MRGAAAGEPSEALKPVFLDYTQEELDRAYDQTAWAPNREELLARYAASSDAVRSRLGTPKTFAYGPTSVEWLDVYRTSQANAPIAVFLHGGAWRRGSAKAYAFPAESFVEAGAHYVAVEFDVVMNVGLDGMVDQVRRAVAWVHRNAGTFGGDPSRLYVLGHSSGAHLAGNVIVTDWSGAFGLPADVVKGAVCVSGMYDLAPVRLSARSDYVKFDDRIEHEYSAQRHLSRLGCPVIVGYGDRESPEFQRQSTEFAGALRERGKLGALLVGAGCNHFEVIETLADPGGLLGRAAQELMGLA